MAVKRTSVLANTSRNARSNDRQVSEFDGGWVNIGVNVKDPETGEMKFVRLPLGVSVADLDRRRNKIYPKTVAENPSLAAELQMQNTMIDQICAAFLKLEEGESLETELLDVRLYRANQEADPADLEVEAPTFDLFAKA